jgi:hypothetical protein
MFMDAETGAAEPVAPVAPAPVEQLPAPTPAPAPASAPSTRGWTMFMEADVPNEPAPAPAPESQPSQPSQPDVAPDAVGAVSGASDSKGWTVFMERQPIAPPPGYTGPMPSYAPTPAELATTVEQPAQPPLETPVQPVELASTPAAEQPGVSKQTVVMDRAPDIAPPQREPSGSSVPASVPATPAIETQPRAYVPAPIPASGELDRRPSKLPIYIGVGVIVIIIIVIIIIAAT